MVKLPKLSIVTACHNNRDTLARAVSSVLSDDTFEVQHIVVDDGSSPALTEADLGRPTSDTLLLLRQDENLGKPAACNLGFSRSTGEYVFILDSDDELIPGWGVAVKSLIESWPAEAPIAFTWSKDTDGNITGMGSGTYSRSSWLCGAGAGEYMAFFRGDVAREYGYLEPGCKRICGTLSYSYLLQSGPLYIHPVVTRIYHTEDQSSLSRARLDANKAHDLYLCFNASREWIERYDAEQGVGNPAYLPGLYFREIAYRALSGERVHALRDLRKARAKLGIVRSLALLPLMVMPCGVFVSTTRAFKRLGILRQFG